MSYRARPRRNSAGKISIESFFPTSPDVEAHVEQIVRWSRKESMVAITTDSIKRHQCPHAAFVQDEDGTRVLGGYAAITHLYSTEVIELGGLIVSPYHRGLGIASSLVKAVVEDARDHLPNAQVLAFSNPTSSELFSHLGGVQIESANELPVEVWKTCHLCRYYEEKVIKAGQQCCGRVFDISAIETGKIDKVQK